MFRSKSQRKPKMPAGAIDGPLAARHLTLVACIARDVHKNLPPGVSLDDLVGAGNLGLVESARRFDPAKGASFSTFARHRVRGAITDSLRRLDPMPRRLRTEQKRAQRATSALAAQLGRMPSEAEVAEQLQLPVVQWQRLRRQLSEAGCGTDGSGVTGCGVLPESLPGTWHDPERYVELGKLRSLLDRALEALPARHRGVIRLYDFEEWPMKRIGERLGLTEGRVSQIRSSALKLLRAELTRYGAGQQII